MIFVSILGIVTLVGLAWALGFNGAPHLADADAARAEVAAVLPGFAPAEVALDAEGRAALVAARDGRIALIRPMGDRWVVRLLSGTRTEVAADTLTLRLPEPLFGATTLDLGDAASAWAKRLGAGHLA